MQVYSYVFTIVKNQSLAEEITQNTFYKAMTARRQYEGKAGELTWLCSIAKNLAIETATELRTKYRRCRALIEELNKNSFD